MSADIQAKKNRVIGVVMLLGLALSIAAYVYGFDGDYGVGLLYWGILPGLPYFIIAYIGKSSVGSHRYAIIGAATALTIFVVLIFGGFLWSLHAPLPAAIGVGIGVLLLYSPIWYLLVASIGWLIGGAIGKRAVYKTS